MTMLLSDLHSGIDRLVKSGLFDERWYLAQYPDVSASGLSPAEHYVRYGARLKRRPNPLYEEENTQICLPESMKDMVVPGSVTAGLSGNEVLQPPVPPRQLADDSLSARGAVAKATEIVTPSKGQAALPLQELSTSAAAEPAIAAVKCSVEQLKLKLWGGFSRYAVQGLEDIKNDCSMAAAERAEAAYCLMQWFYVVENYSRAYANIQLYGMLCNAFLDKQFVIGSTLCLIKLQRYREANELIDAALDDRTRSAIYLSDYLFLKASILRGMNPGEQGEREQLALYSDAFKSMGLAPVEKIYREAPLYFGNLTATASARITDQRQKVSIIIPAYNAAASISYVIRSLQAQTWSNIEIIVVDDCSTDNTSDVVREIMRFDPRIKLICKSVNEGAYPARNTGLKEAAGELIMVHDSDDWSHPQKIEIQIVALNQTPGAVASMSNWIRVDDKFMPSVHSRPRDTIKSLSFPSLLFKKEIIKEIGPWAAVRVGGDAEFRTRIERYYGSGAIALISKVLSISLSREGSLTQNSATHINTLHFGVRWQYLNLYDYFHSQQLKHDPDCANCLSVSNAVVGNRSKRNAVNDAFDYVFVSDFVSDVFLIKYVAAACAAGAKVAVYHWRNFEEDASLPLCTQLYELCLRHRIGLITCSDVLESSMVIIGDLDILRFRQDRFPSISSCQVIGLLHKKPRIFAEHAVNQQALVQIRATTKTLFGRDIRLVPASPRLRESLHALGLQDELEPDPLLPAVDPMFWSERGLKQSRLKKERVEVVYPNGACSGLFNCAHSGAAKDARQELDVAYSSINISGLSNSAIKDMISGADFYVYCPEGECDEFGSGILEAMALGVPVILTPELESLFGKAALYAKQDGVEELIRNVWKNEVRYLACAQNARKFVQMQCSPKSFSHRLQRLGGMTAAG